jgi:hypothetical protein
VIRDRVFLGGRSGQWSYTVIVEGHQQNVIESSLKARPGLDDPQAWVTREPTPARRFGATLTRAKSQSKFANTLFSFRATRTTFRPYQFKPVLKLLQTGRNNRMLWHPPTQRTIAAGSYTEGAVKIFHPRHARLTLLPTILTMSVGCWCSQKRNTVQPAACSAAVWSRSRLALPSSFADQ